MKKNQKKCAECGIEWKDAKSKHYSYKLEKYVCDKCVGCNPIMNNLRIN